jgi:hypothetical protein
MSSGGAFSVADDPLLMTSPTARPVGAYGLRVEGVSDSVRRLLGTADPSWPAVVVRSGISHSTDKRAFVSKTRARVGMPGGGEITVERSPMVAEVRLPTRPRDDELLHPYLGYVGAIVSRWLGRDCVHAGAFVVEDGAWAMVGERQAGKSSMLGWLAAGGHDVVCDDVLVIANERVFPGPRFVDLRPEAAAVLGSGTPIGMVGARERWRLEVGPVPTQLPLRGWIFLSWASKVEVGPATAVRRFSTIKEQLSLFTSPRDPASLLDLASLPAFELRRPLGWASMAEAADRLLAAIAG